MHKNIDILLIALSSPIMVGIYEDNKLIDSIVSDKKSSDILATIFKDIFDKYDVEGLYFTNGPGSFMAIKVAYIFLKSISIIKDIELFATDAFKFNENRPIKAIGKLYFVKIKQEIKTQKFDDIQTVEFKLPKLLNKDEFSTDTVPLYKIGAVG
ncbi:MAG: hypothetical protein ABGW74_04435 [Campylobacterales bacterium]